MSLLSLQQGWFATIFLVGVIGFVFLQISNIRYPKPTKKLFLFLPCIVLVVLLLFLKTLMAARVAIFMIIIGLGYVLFGTPFFQKKDSNSKNEK